jgi:HEPN domain-containing protein
MKPITSEWFDKAEGDWATLMREFRARKNPNYDAVCFHSQQCAEKYLKGKLQEAGIAIKKTHDLEVILNEVLKIEPAWSNMIKAANSLTVYAVKFRYPGDSADKIESKDSIKQCRLIRETIRQSFGLPI